MNVVPNIIIIGAQKSGSTFIQSALEHHPDVSFVSGEVPIFEDPDYRHYSANYFSNLFQQNNLSLDCYNKGIKRPNYLTSPEVPDRIRKHCPNSSLIAVLRNPVERALASLLHNIKYGKIPFSDPNRTLLELFSKDGGLQKRYPVLNQIIDFGLYGKALKRYLTLGLFDNMHIIIFDDFKSNPVRVISDLYKSLHLDDLSKALNYKKKPQEVIYNSKRLKLYSYLSSYYYNYNHDKSRLEVKTNIPSRAISKIHNLVDKSILRQALRSKFKLSDDVISVIKDFYRDDILLTQDLLDRDLSKWL